MHDDIRNEKAVEAERAVKGCEVIFHLAASVGNKRSIDLPVDDAEINVIGTLRILEAARRHGVRKVVASSSAGVFGELKTLPIRRIWSNRILRTAPASYAKRNNALHIPSSTDSSRSA